MSEDTESKSKAPGPIALARLYLLRRRPASLATDGLALLLLSVLVSHAWSAFYSTLDPARLNARPDSFFAAFTHPNTLYSLFYELSLYTGLVVVSWAGVRMISDSVRSRAGGSEARSGE